MPHHILRNRHIDVILSIVDLKLETDEIREDRGGAGLGSDGRRSLAGDGADDGEAGGWEGGLVWFFGDVVLGSRSEGRILLGPYGTICGPRTRVSLGNIQKLY